MLTRFFISAFAISLASAIARQPLEIRFVTPPTGGENAGKDFFDDAEKSVASQWESQAQPVGNGRIGAMIFGLPWNETIQFNDASLWTGNSNPSGGYDRDGDFGSYQNFGDLLINLDEPAELKMENYSRVLDLRTGIHTTTWTSNGVIYKREVFANKPDEVIVVRLSSNTDLELPGSITLKGAHEEAISASGDSVSFHGTLRNDLRYAASAKVLTDGGEILISGSSVHFKGREVIILLAAGTDYALEPETNFRNGKNPVATVEQQLESATARKSELRERHLEDFTPLMERVDLDLGEGPDQATPERLENYRKGGADPNLEALMFHYGRYLLISSSRDFLPANLQGLWNDTNEPAWSSDYHTNINIQMNYWLAEPANLSECAQPLFDWTLAMIPETRTAFAKEFGQSTPGWTMRTSVNIFGGNGWEWNLPSSAWLAQSFWDHYAYTGDLTFLEKQAWPVLEAVSAFWLDHLIEKEGKLAAPHGWSPEHGPREDGTAHDQQMIWDLLDNTASAAKALGKDDAFVGKYVAARDQLLGPKIGSWGQLMEWTTEYPELEKSGHRHTSHLFAIYPGHQISLQRDPELAAAAAVSLDARGTSGDSRRSWTWPWRLALWARLGHPERSAEMMRGLLTHNTMPNLFATHPPFQIDGNLGITAAVCETLLQSNHGEISVLSALLPHWQSGSFKGLKARDGFEVSATWESGKLTQSTLKSLLGKTAVLRFNHDPKVITINGDTNLTADADGAFRLETKPGEIYQITF